MAVHNQHAIMKRRDFLTASMAVTTLAGLNCAYGQSRNKKGANRASNQERYELRVYHLKSSADRGLLDAYLSKALIPALNRLNSNPVGVFVQQERSEKPAASEVRDDKAVLVLIPVCRRRVLYRRVREVKCRRRV
jgi:hypothetical protein